MKLLTILFASILVFGPAPSGAAVSEGELAEIRADLLKLMDRIDALEEENKQLKAVNSSNGWANTIKLQGDVRYRYENIDVENAKTRERNRVRARLSVTARVSDNVEAGIGLASGSDDPTSTNQTLGDAGTTKNLGLNLAYFKWRSAKGLNIIGGKFKNIWYQPEGHGLLWDGDYSPEGLALTHGDGPVFFNAAINWLESDSRSASARFAYGLQAGYVAEIGGGELTAGAGFYDVGVKGKPVFRGDNDDFFGNRFTCLDATSLEGCTYDNNYEEIQIFAHLKTKLADQPFILFADYVNNVAADHFDTGWAIGLVYGKASNPGTWQISYTYQDIEADAVFAATTDSDFAGGGTDGKGSILKGSLAIQKDWKISFSYFDNVSNVDFGTPRDFNRLQLDTAFKF